MRRRTLLLGGGPALVLPSAGVPGRRAIPSVPPAAAAPAVVTRVHHEGGRVVVEPAEHPPGGPHAAVDGRWRAAA